MARASSNVSQLLAKIDTTAIQGSKHTWQYTYVAKRDTSVLFWYMMVQENGLNPALSLQAPFLAPKEYVET